MMRQTKVATSKTTSSVTPKAVASSEHCPFFSVQPIRGFYGSGRDARAPCRLLLLGESFSADSDGQRGTGPGARFEECRTMGVIKNVNTKEVRLLRSIYRDPAPHSTT